ncbi:vWA domain-containing protein [Heyndrickxia sporothermodurans]|uniref:D-amino acid dehydrogenase large subunit n=1 Tax=Heyndrickxia sporothermodurans TaxID=46224 RepID=A0A150LCL4_9BACI|nr:VWA domain-containing protein [Heyndrickxia sporothermodurans]KYD09980.1 D-amino acid dehydrogenase large subunit [Heyndrickxia sporothermodurans]
MKKLLYVFLFLSLILAACSKDTSQPANVEKDKKQSTEVKKEEEKSESEYTAKEVKYYDIEMPKRDLSDIEKELLRYPGKYSGDQYDEEKVKEALDQLPDDLTKEQYMEELKFLLSEDYHKEMETLLNFDSTVNISVDRPDESVEIPGMKTAHYAILIDASGSMKASVGGKSRMEAAKEAVLEFAEQIPENATISMRVYGHKGTGSDSDKKMSCSSSENFYNGRFDKSKFNQSLKKVKPAGWTPIGLALNKVKEDIPKNTDEVVVYVVSDGIETCGGNPVKAAKELVSADIKTVVNIIGFDVDNKGQKLLKNVATAGNGEFTYVNSERDLKKYLRAQYEEIQKAWIEWKEEGKRKSIDLKEEKKTLAINTKESMKEKSIREKERMKQAGEYLKTRFEDYSHPARQLFSKIVSYGDSKWKYAVDTGNLMWREVVDNGNDEWRKFVDEGNKKIKETIDKKNGN